MSSGTNLYVLNDEGTIGNNADWLAFAQTVSPLYFRYDFQPNKTHFSSFDMTSTNNDNVLLHNVVAWLSHRTIAFEPVA